MVLRLKGQLQLRSRIDHGGAASRNTEKGSGLVSPVRIKHDVSLFGDPGIVNYKNAIRLTYSISHSRLKLKDHRTGALGFSGDFEPGIQSLPDYV